MLDTFQGGEPIGKRTNIKVKKSKTPVRSQSLEVLNEQSRSTSFDVSEIEGLGSIDLTKNWMPDNMLPTSYLPSYTILPGSLRKEINQKYAQAICEQFIWFEQVLLCQILDHIVETQELDPALKECLIHFSEEEDKHSELFWRVLEKSDPEKYSQREFYYFHPLKIQSFYIDRIAKNPKTFLVWIWLAIFFEERTIEFSRKYRQHKDEVDFTFFRAHDLHLIDECRHVQVDQYLLKHFYDDSANWKKSLCSKMLRQILKSYLSPKRISNFILKEMQLDKSKEEKRQLQKLRMEIHSLRSNERFQRATFGSKALPRTHKILQSYPEMSAIYEMLPGDNFSA